VVISIHGSHCLSCLDSCWPRDGGQQLEFLYQPSPFFASCSRLFLFQFRAPLSASSFVYMQETLHSYIHTHTHANAMFPMDCNHNDAKTQHAPYANRCPLFSVHRKQTGRQRPSSQPVANNPQLMMSPSNQSLSNDLPYLVKVEFGGYGTAKANLIPIVNTNLIFALGVMSQ